jgi:hypothetical protein
MSKRRVRTLSILTFVTLAIAVALTVNTIIVKQAFAFGGTCSNCATLFAPGTESGTGGTIGGGHEPAKAFAPGQLSSGSASDSAPGHLKP